MDNTKEIIEGLCHQFGYAITFKGRAALSTGGLSALEDAFDYLGWDDPHFVPGSECEIDGCYAHATCGAKTANGYKRMCGEHYRIYGVRRERR